VFCGECVGLVGRWLEVLQRGSSCLFASKSELGGTGHVLRALTQRRPPTRTSASCARDSPARRICSSASQMGPPWRPCGGCEFWMGGGWQLVIGGWWLVVWWLAVRMGGSWWLWRFDGWVVMGFAVSFQVVGEVLRFYQLDWYRFHFSGCGSIVVHVLCRMVQDLDTEMGLQQAKSAKPPESLPLPHTQRPSCPPPPKRNPIAPAAARCGRSATPA